MKYQEIWTNKSIVKNNSLNPYNDTSINIEILNYPRNCPYLKTDGSSRVLKMEFLNENSMKLNNTEKDINSYLKEIYKNEFDFFSYNKCQICHKKNNEFFCKKCSKNICGNCKNNLHKECNSKLIELKKEKKRVRCLIKKINKIIEKFKLEINKDDLNVGNNTFEGKEQNDNKFNPNQIDENNIFNSDIDLATEIIKAKYRNFFHYENIERLYNYFKNSYEGISNNRCFRLTITKKNGEEKYNEKYEEKIAKDNINILSLVINGVKSSVVSWIQTKESFLQILIVQIVENIPIQSMCLMFKFFVEEKAAFRYNLSDVLGRPKIKIPLFNLKSIINKILIDNKGKISYEDNNKKCVKNGIGILYYVNNKIAFKGQIENCARNGEGILYYENGLKAFEGNWENNEAEGYGKFYFEKDNFTLKYIGNWKNNLANGKGKIILYGKLYYEGEFVNGSMEGEGKTHFESKDEYVDYEGHYENCFWHGKGTRYYKDKTIMYQGDYKFGKENGRGKYYNNKNGEYYVGEFKDGLPTGEGTWYNSDGSIKK